MRMWVSVYGIVRFFQLLKNRWLKLLKICDKIILVTIMPLFGTDKNDEDIL